jgi:glucose-6-phosphate 1-dehydrogenase
VDLGSLLNAVAVVVALVTAGGFGLQRSRVAALRADREDDRARIVALREDLTESDRERAKDKAKAAEERSKDKAQIERLASDLRHAEEMARGQAHWLALDQHQEEHHQQALTHWALERAIWGRIEEHLDREVGP